MVKKKQSLTKGSKVDPRSLLEKLSSDIEKKGVAFFQPDVNLNIDAHYLTLPHDLTECIGVELGRYLNAFTQQRMYMRTMCGWQSVVLEEKRREYLIKSSAEYKKLSNQRLSETSKDKMINADPKVFPHYRDYVDEKEKLNLIETVLSSIEDGIFLISREISRRNHDWDTENRNENVQSIKRGKNKYV